MKKRSRAEKGTFVQFFHIGFLFVENTFKRVLNRDISRLSIPESAFAFRFFDLLLTEKTVKKIKEKGVLSCRCYGSSPKYFYGGKVYGMEDLKQEYLRNDAIPTGVANKIKKTKSQKAILCRTGNWQFFKDKDVLLKVE